MDTEDLINRYNTSKAQTEQLHNKLRKHQLEAAMRAYKALQDAYACGVVFCDDDKIFGSNDLLPCEPFDYMYGLDRDGNVILRFTHNDEHPYFKPEDFPQM